MSRAFVKEHEDDDERQPDRPVPPGPNYVTPLGLEQLKEALAEAEAAGSVRDLRYFTERVTSAILVDPAGQPADRVAFGATVKARDARGHALEFRIVGDDEADPLKGNVSWQSPVAQAMVDHHAGEKVKVLRPAGPIEYKIESITYE